MNLAIGRANDNKILSDTRKYSASIALAKGCNNLSVYLPGHADSMDSYGIVGLELSRHLTRMGVYVNLLPMGKRQMGSQDAETAAITAQPIQPSLGGIFFGYPTGFHAHTNPLAHMGPRIGITMFESSRILDSWIEPLNALDAVIVPSTFCAQVFAECGVTAPIHIIPLGVSDTCQYQSRPMYRPLTFLAFNDRGRRKGGHVAVQAFVRAFGDDPAYQLLVKSRTPKVKFTYTNPNITVIQRDMTEQELYELYLSADVLINPHRGEGFGLLPREFAATGGLSLTTDWSGTADHLSEWGVGLPYTLEPADWSDNATLQGQDLGVWATLNSAQIAVTLKRVADNWTWYNSRARGRANRARALYSWRAFAQEVLEVWEGVSVGYSYRLAAA